jgi:hypothetical protein
VNDLVPRRFQPLVLGALAVAAIILAIANFTAEEGESGSPGAFVVTLVVTIAVAILLWRFLMQPALAGDRPAARDGLIVGVVAVLLALVYWTGLPWALGPVAVALGTLSREGRASRARADAGPDPAAGVVPSDRKTGTAALALGWLALAAATVAGIIDGVL